MNRADFEHAFETWVRRLGLGGVSFAVVLADRADDMPQQDSTTAVGAADSRRDVRAAQVAIKVPAAVLSEDQPRPPAVARNGALDLEATIVHELLHVLMRQCGYPDDEQKVLEENEEQLVSVLERALLNRSRVLDPEAAFDLGIGRGYCAPWLDENRWLWTHWRESGART